MYVYAPILSPCLSFYTYASWNPLAVPIANTASGRFLSWVATLAAKSWTVSRDFADSPNYYNDNFNDVANQQQQRRLPNLQLHRRLPQPLQRRLPNQHNASLTNSTTTPTPPQPTQRPAHLHAYYHYHNHYTDASPTNTTLRLPTQLLHRHPLNQHNASHTYKYTTTTTTTTCSSRFRLRTRAVTQPATHLSAEGQQTARRKIPLSLPISAYTNIHFHHSMFSIRSHPIAPLRFLGRSARPSFGEP